MGGIIFLSDSDGGNEAKRITRLLTSLEERLGRLLAGTGSSANMARIYN